MNNEQFVELVRMAMKRKVLYWYWSHEYFEAAVDTTSYRIGVTDTEPELWVLKEGRELARIFGGYVQQLYIDIRDGDPIQGLDAAAAPLKAAIEESTNRIVNLASTAPEPPC